MRIWQSLMACVAALVVWVSVSYAGPCSQEIARFRAEIDAKQHSNAAAGLSAPESTATPPNARSASERMVWKI